MRTEWGGRKEEGEGKGGKGREGKGRVTYEIVLASLSRLSRATASACSGMTSELGRMTGSVFSGWCGRCGFSADLLPIKTK